MTRIATFSEPLPVVLRPQHPAFSAPPAEPPVVAAVPVCTWCGQPACDPGCVAYPVDDDNR